MGLRLGYHKIAPYRLDNRVYLEGCGTGFCHMGQKQGSYF